MSLSPNTRSIIMMTRPINGLMGCLTIIIGWLNTIPEDGRGLKPSIFLACLAYCFSSSSGMIINDIYDFRMDKVNRPTRPMPGGRVSIWQARLLYVIMLVAATLFAVLHGIIEDLLIVNICLLILFGMIGWIYAAYGKKSGFAGNILVSIAFSAGIIYGALVNTYSIPAYIFWFFLTSFSLLLSREIIKGGEDIRVDKAEGAKTLAVIMGVERSVGVAVVFAGIALIFFILPAFSPLKNPSAFMALMIPASLVVIYALRLMLIGNNSRKKLGRISLLLKAGALLGLIAFLAASF